MVLKEGNILFICGCYNFCKKMIILLTKKKLKVFINSLRKEKIK